MKLNKYTALVSTVILVGTLFTQTSHAQMAMLSQGPPPSSEGIPGLSDQPDPKDLLETAYTTADKITKVIQDASAQPIGQQIGTYRDAVKSILDTSHGNPQEEYARIILNRAVDTANFTIGHAGNNPEVIAQLVANFYLNSYRLALSYTNNPTGSVAAYLRTASRAQFGQIFSTFMWVNQANLTSDSYKAVVLFKLLDYLEYDFNNDLLYRRAPGVKEVVADIEFIKSEDPNYAAIKESLDKAEEPKSSNVAALRLKVHILWSGLPSRLNASGVKVLPMEEKFWHGN